MVKIRVLKEAICMHGDQSALFYLFAAPPRVLLYF
jgi:hypothetical protein